MKISGERRIPASPVAVFSALNNTETEVLRRSIPGCEAIEVRSPTEMTATVALKIGPVKMRLSGEVTPANIDPPHGYAIQTTSLALDLEKNRNT